MSAIRCRGLTAWHKGEQVLKGVDLLVEPGEVCLLLGASGSGRTRLVELILGLRRPSSGSVEVLETTPVRFRSRSGTCPGSWRCTSTCRRRRT